MSCPIFWTRLLLGDPPRGQSFNTHVIPAKAGISLAGYSALLVILAKAGISSRRQLPARAAYLAPSLNKSSRRTPESRVPATRHQAVAAGERDPGFRRDDTRWRHDFAHTGETPAPPIAPFRIISAQAGISISTNRPTTRKTCQRNRCSPVIVSGAKQAALAAARSSDRQPGR